MKEVLGKEEVDCVNYKCTNKNPILSVENSMWHEGKGR